MVEIHLSKAAALDPLVAQQPNCVFIVNNKQQITEACGQICGH